MFQIIQVYNAVVQVCEHQAGHLGSSSRALSRCFWCVMSAAQELHSAGFNSHVSQDAGGAL
jgi:hypothetical protein